MEERSQQQIDNQPRGGSYQREMSLNDPHDPQYGFRIRYAPTYDRDLKRAELGQETALLLSATWDDILAAVIENPDFPDVQRAGDPIPRNNHELYKLRVADPSRNKGSRGSYRLVYWIRRHERELVGLFLYHKSEKEDVIQKEIEKAKTRFLTAS